MTTKRSVLPYLAACFFLCPSPVRSEPPQVGSGVTNTGVIHLQQAIVATQEGKSEFAALQQRFLPKQVELQRLNAEVEALKKQGDPKAQELQRRLRETLETAQKDFQVQQKAITERISGKLMPVLRNYAQENGFSTVLDLSQEAGCVFWAARESDITRAVVDAYEIQFGGGASLSSPAAPTMSRPGRVVFLDVQRALSSTKEGRREFTALQKRFEPQLAELHALNKEVADLRARLNSAGSASRSEMEQTFRVKQQQLQKGMEEGQNRFASEQNKLAQTIGAKLVGVADQYARRAAIGVILDSSNRSLAQPKPDFALMGGLDLDHTQDVTDDIVRFYDQQFSRGESLAFTSDEVVCLLQKEVTAKRVASLVREKGVDFQLSDAIEQRIRAAGGDDNLLLAIATAGR